jgi:hypothetical protein
LDRILCFFFLFKQIYNETEFAIPQYSSKQIYFKKKFFYYFFDLNIIIIKTINFLWKFFQILNNANKLPHINVEKNLYIFVPTWFCKNAIIFIKNILQQILLTLSFYLIIRAGCNYRGEVFNNNPENHITFGGVKCI